MSKSPAYQKIVDDVPPSFHQAPGPNVHPMNNLPQSHAQYGYDQQPYGQTTRPNVIQVQPGAVPAVPGATTVIIQQQDVMPSMSGHLVLSCFVFWCCNPLFGMIAFFVAICGMNASTPAEGRSLGKSSMWVSVSGVIISVVLCAVLAGLFLGGIIDMEHSFNDDINHAFNDVNDDINDAANDWGRQMSDVYDNLKNNVDGGYSG